MSAARIESIWQTYNTRVLTFIRGRLLDYLAHCSSCASTTN